MIGTGEEIALRRVIDHPPQADDFELRPAAIEPPGPGEILVRVIYLSLDPYVGSILRGRHLGEPRPGPGDVPPGRAIGEVVASAADGFSPGDIVRAETGWRTHSRIPAARAVRIAREDAPLSAQLGIAGMPGLTAWAAMARLAKVAGGEHALIGSAAGAVGGAAGQIARILGAARVVGLAGSQEKCALVREVYRFDDCINYRAPDWRERLARAFPRGIDVYLDTIGGDALDAALANLAHYGRIVLCGLASQYQAETRPAGPNPGLFIARRAQVFGLVVYDFEGEQAEWTRRAGAWLREGRLVAREDRAENLAGAPLLFEKLIRGENIGKAIVAVAPERTEA